MLRHHASNAKYLFINHLSKKLSYYYVFYFITWGPAPGHISNNSYELNGLDALSFLYILCLADNHF